jgi:hypothetical protein
MDEVESYTMKKIEHWIIFYLVARLSGQFSSSIGLLTKHYLLFSSYLHSNELSFDNLSPSHCALWLCRFSTTIVLWLK